MVTRVEIGIDGGPSPVNAGAIEQIAKHEVGHALGLGHANWDGDLMSPLVQPTPAPIPLCDINAVRQANSWKMIDNGRRPKPASASQSALLNRLPAVSFDTVRAPDPECTRLVSAG